jgi:hypothetical protein
MAQVKLAYTLDSIIGSIGQETFSMTHSGLILKQKSQPGSKHTFTPSASQLSLRAMFGAAAATFKTLDDATIRAWNDLGKTMKASNKFNDSYNPTGFNVFCEFNQNRQLIGKSIITTCPTDLTTVVIPSFILSLDASGTFNIRIKFAGYTTESNVEYLIYATPATSPGRKYCKVLYRNIDIIPSGTTDVYDCSDAYNLKFVAPAPGQRVNVKLIPINSDCGFAAMPLTNYSIVT